MKITYLHQYFNTPDMPGSTRSFEIAKSLVDKGHNVTIITQSNKPHNKLWKNTFEYGINIYWLSSYYSNKLNFFQRILVFLKFSLFATIKALKIDADLVFASSTPLTIVIPGYISAIFQKACFVLEVRDLWPDIPVAMGYLKSKILRSIAYRLEIFSYQKANLIVTLSSDMKTGILKLGIPSDKVIVVTNFSDLVAFRKDSIARDKLLKKYSLEQDTIIILYAGTFGHVNGVDYLVYLANKLKELEKVKFFLVGDGREVELIQNLANKFNCFNKNVFIIPQVSKSEVVSFFNSSDIAVSTIIDIPELEANSANKFFDGLAAGCCFLINHNGWQADFLNENHCGIVLSHDINQSVIKIKEYLGDSNLIKQLGLNARIASQYFEKNKQIDFLETQMLITYNKYLTSKK